MKKLILMFILCSTAFGVTTRVPLNLNTFNAGELSPLMNARADFPKYSSGARTLENMIVRSQGPISRRPGTKYIASVKTAADPTRIIPFEYSTTDAYIIEMGDEYFRFYRNGGQIQSAGSPYEIVSPYDKTDLFEVQFAQDAQIMRMVHPDYAPYKLTRTAHTAWTMTEIVFEDGPFIDENDDTTITITPSARIGSITLTASSAIFDVSDHVGALWEISYLVDSNSVNERIIAVGETVGPVTVHEDQEFTWVTSGHWGGTMILERSEDDGSTWGIVGPPATYDFDGNIQYTGLETEKGGAEYRLRMTVRNFGDDNICKATLTAIGFEQASVVDITAVASTTSATATVIDTLPDTAATWRWAEGAWSTFRGFPRTIEHHEQRAIYGGSASFPQTIWSSITAADDTDYDDLSIGTDDDDAWIYVLPGMNPLQWMRSGDFLMIGTTAAIGRLGTPDKALTPTFVEYRKQAQNGSAYIQAVNAVDAILFVERGGQKIREVTYTFNTDRYIAPDLTVLAEHVTGDGIVQIDFQNRPDPVLWCVREDGELLSFTYKRRHDVLAWSRSDTGASGLFKSVATIPGPNETEVWTVAARTIDSNSVQYIEAFQSVDWTKTSSPTDANDMWFVDSGHTDGNDLSHLEGETVAVLADARPIGTFIVSGGAITASGYTNYVIGLPYTSVYESMPVVAQAQGLSSALMKTAVLNVVMDFQDTLACNLGVDSTNKSAIQFSKDSFATTIDAFTGVKPSTFPRGLSRDMTIYVDTSDPVPLTLRSVNPFLQVTHD